MKTFSLIFIGLILLYTFCAGPVVWLGNKLEWSENTGVGKYVLIFLYPHVVAYEKIPIYEKYLDMWRGR